MSLSAHTYEIFSCFSFRLGFAINKKCEIFVVQLISFKPSAVHRVENIFPFVSTVADPDSVNPSSDPDPDSEPGKYLKKFTSLKKTILNFFSISYFLCLLVRIPISDSITYGSNQDPVPVLDPQLSLRILTFL